MDFGSSTVAFIIGFVLVAVYLFNRGNWNQRTNEDLFAKASGSDWSQWKNAFVELRQRGVDVAPFVPQLAARLLSDSMVEREAARITLSDLFPDWQQALSESGYVSTQAPAEARPRLAAVFERMGIPLP